MPTVNGGLSAYRVADILHYWHNLNFSKENSQQLNGWDHDGMLSRTSVGECTMLNHSHRCCVISLKLG